MKKKQVSNGSAQESAETFVLLIWDDVPESTKMYLVPGSELTEEDIAVLRIAHGHIMNTVDLTDEQEQAIDKVSNVLCSNEEYISEQYAGTRWAMRLAKYLVDPEEPIEGKRIASVYRTGFML